MKDVEDRDEEQPTNKDDQYSTVAKKRFVCALQESEGRRVGRGRVIDVWWGSVSKRKRAWPGKKKTTKKNSRGWGLPYRN